MEGEHQKLVCRTIASAKKRAASPLQNISKPTAWRGGVQVLEEVERDAKPSKRCEEKRKEWARHWQCNTEVQDLELKPWWNAKLRCLEAKRRYMERAARSHKIATGAGCDGFHTKVPLDFS